MKTTDTLQHNEHHSGKAEDKVDLTGTAFLSGMLVFAGLVGYFLIMQLTGLHKILILRSLNFVFLFAGIYFALKYVHDKIHDRIKYFNGVRLGIQISLFAVIPFAIFMYIMLVNDPGFMYYIQTHSIAGQYLTPANASVVVSIEGITSGAMITFILMQYFKKN